MQRAAIPTWKTTVGETRPRPTKWHLTLISDRPELPAIGYHLETYQFGAITGSVDGSIRVHG